MKVRSGILKTLLNGEFKTRAEQQIDRLEMEAELNDTYNVLSKYIRKHVINSGRLIKKKQKYCNNV